ncbi:hypothetical protein [Lacrimispora amygdalina]|uniref:hypothetical protein n=1 Tax=Lacrimispora amygdalina TaxID=253257 RepID=UPI000BE29B53|nr:hypothetical protein [Lacrimispora amygdalina]
MVSKNEKVQKLALILKHSEIVKNELEGERDESLNNLRFDGEEELLIQYYKKNLTSVYRIRNNAATLLLRNNCYCTVSEDNVTLKLYIDDLICEFSIPTIKNILQSDFDRILEKNRVEVSDIIPIKTIQGNSSSLKHEKEFQEKEPTLDIKNKTEISSSISEVKENLQENIEKPVKDIFVDRKNLRCDIPEKLITNSHLLKVTAKPEIRVPLEVELPNLEKEFDLSKDETDALFWDDEPDEDFKFDATDILDQDIEKEEINSLLNKDINNKEILSKEETLNSSEKFKFNKLANSVIPEHEDSVKAGAISSDSKRTELVEPEDTAKEPIFSSETIDLDPEDIIKKLKEAKSRREEAELEQIIMKESKDNPCNGKIFDISTGKTQSGRIDVHREANKIVSVAEGVVNTSKRDTITNKKIELNLDRNVSNEAYQIQTDSDFERDRKEFLFDKYMININIFNDNEEFLRAEEAELIVFPLDIPESGNSLVTDICACFESNGESHIAAVSPGGKTTVSIKSEEYAIFIRGSWENGNFVTALSIIGVGRKIKSDIKREQIRPENIKKVGIGHNMLYIDHTTTVHILPKKEINNIHNGEYVDFVAVIIRDYGIDKDCETAFTNKNVEMKIKGERFNYNIIGKWENDRFKIRITTK